MRQLKITSRVTNRETASFVQYLKNIADIDLLTPQEELELSQRSILGDRAAINELVSRNLRFVVSVAKQYATSAIPVEDLINEGNLGLIKAAERFDGKLGNRFISYAVSWIRKSILEYLNNTGKMIRLPANKVNDVSKLDKKMGELEQMMGRNVDVQELMSEFEGDFDLSNLDLLSVIGTYSIDSLDRDINGDEGHVTLGELIGDDTAYGPTDGLVHATDLKSEIQRILGGLKERDQRIMTKLFGLDDGIPMTQGEVALQEGLSREMVRQIREKSLKKLEIKHRNSSLRNYL